MNEIGINNAVSIQESPFKKEKREYDANNWWFSQRETGAGSRRASVV